ncbi:MAG: hypothetical protein Alpg2KO_16050 [Alphaproteobacteria bacterium]
MYKAVKFLKRRSGASLVGYGLVVGLISVISLAALTQTGEDVRCLMEVAGDRIGGDFQTSCAPTLGAGQTDSAGNLICPFGQIANYNNTQCFAQEDPPVPLALSQASNSNALSVTWQDGEGYVGCTLDIQLGPDQFQEVANVGNCAEGLDPATQQQTLNEVFALSTSTSWDGARVVLRGTLARNTPAGKQTLADFGALTCDDSMSGSQSPTPTIDEDCINGFDNNKIDAADEVLVHGGGQVGGLTNSYLLPAGGRPVPNFAISNSWGTNIASGPGASHVCRCTLNDLDAVPISGSIVTATVHASFNRSTVNFRNGPPAECYQLSSQSTLTTDPAFQMTGVESLRCGVPRYY